MALSLASASITFANPLMAPVKWVAESSIVGRDLRDTRNQVAKSLARFAKHRPRPAGIARS